MINITDKTKCCGCNACYDVCPQNAIKLESDIEGFWYPSVDTQRCTNCGLCEKICPLLHVNELKKNEFKIPVCYAARHKNIETVFNSTTGGIFSAFAEQTYREGGYVGGAIYREDWSVAHFISNDPNDLLRIRQSKYSQSDTRGFYKSVESLLQSGKKVLVCGTPCQMAGLRMFLRKDYSNIIIIDFVCKSITSPLFFEKYLDYWERKANSKLVGFKFKDKELGWRNLVKRFDFKNGKTYYSRYQDNDLYSVAYHGHIVSRPSCYNCQFKGFPRIADITIADFWGCEKYPKYEKLDNNDGTSAVIINNSKGQSFFDKIKPNIRFIESSINEIIPANPALLYKQGKPICDRQAFFHDLCKDPIEVVVPKYAVSLWQSEKPVSLCGKFNIFIREIYKVLRQPISLRKFIYYNFLCKKVKINWSRKGFLYPYKYTIIDLQKGANLELNGPMLLGYKKVNGSKLETRLLIERNAKMIVNESARIWYGSDVEVLSNGELLIDEVGTNIGFNVICGKRIELKGHVSVGRNVSIRDTNAHTIAIDGYKILRPVIIDNHVWLCSGATVCPGVKIGAGAVVGANSFVILNVPAHCLVSGSPAKVIEKNIAWKL